MNELEDQDLIKNYSGQFTIAIELDKQGNLQIYPFPDLEKVQELYLKKQLEKSRKIFLRSK